MANRPAQTRHKRRSPGEGLWGVVRLLLIGGLFAVGTASMLIFPLRRGGALADVKVGDILSEDVVAPREATYVSAIETEAAQQRARASVQDVYDPPDPRIGRQQVRLAGQIMVFIRDVRADTLASDTLRHEYLGKITALNLDEQTRDGLLTISDTDFDALEHEVVNLISEAMGGAVREGQVADAVSQLELKVSATLPEPLIPLSVNIARDLVEPNSVLNVAATTAARQAAEQSVPDIMTTFRAGEVVVRAGEPVTELDIEALEQLGLRREGATRGDVLSAILASLMSTVVFGVYISALRRPWLEQPGLLLLFVLLFLMFLGAGQFIIPSQTLTSYLFPAAALSLAVTATYGVELAALTAIVLAALLGFLANRSLEMSVYLAMSGMLAAGALRRGGRLNAFFVAGIFASAGSIAALLIFRLPSELNSVHLLPLMGMAALGGLISAGLALVILFVVGNVTPIITTLRLLDLMRADHPLQRRLQREALGTYQHTLAVAALAEAATVATGADTLLTRVGTLYHDIGKLNNPGFFTENQAEGVPSPHDGLSPLASARIIIAHVPDGIKMAGRHHLPPRIVDFIREHHGTMPVLFFLARGREEAADAGIKLDETEYYYPGPRPKSRETAILMLCDSCESAARAARPTSGDEIEQIVDRIFQQRMEYHQLDDSGLTLAEINILRDAIARTLKGMYHPRIQYPDPAQVRPARLGIGAAGKLPAVSGEAVEAGQGPQVRRPTPVEIQEGETRPQPGDDPS